VNVEYFPDANYGARTDATLVPSEMLRGTTASHTIHLPGGVINGKTFRLSDEYWVDAGHRYLATFSGSNVTGLLALDDRGALAQSGFTLDATAIREVLHASK
jgi:hypothetical protein